MGSHSRLRTAVSFRTALSFTIVTLVLACAVLGVLGYLQGPRLSEAVVDAAAVASRPDQQLRLFANQLIDDVDPDAVSITPAADLSVSTRDDVVTIQFDDPLLHDTEYSVEVAVTNPYADRASTLEYSFRTDPAEFYFLDRADPTRDTDPTRDGESADGEGESRDRVVRAGVTSAERQTVVSAVGIQDFAVFDAAIAVATLENNESSAVTLVEPGNARAERLDLPAVGTIDLLAGSASAGILGFTFTSNEATGVPEYQEHLFSVDLEGDHAVRPVVGLDGEPLQALAWHFLPGTSRALVQTLDLSLLLVDLSGDSPIVPIGTATELGRISTDGSEVVVGSALGQFALSLEDRRETPLPVAPIDGVTPFGGDIQLVGGDIGRVQQVAIFDDATGSFSSHIVEQDADSSRVLYEKTDQVGSIKGFDVSPNGQYLAVTTVPDLLASVIDGYRVNPEYTNVTTILIDIASGRTIGSVAGFETHW